MTKPLARPLLIFVVSLVFLACGRNKGVDKEIVMSRWIKQDTTLAYTLHVFGWKGDNRMFTEPITSEIRWSRVELHAVDVAWSDGAPYFTGHRQLLVIENAVPCTDLLFSAADSLLTLSYLKRDQAKPRTCYENGATRGSPNPERRLSAGIPDGGGYGNVSGMLDTAALLEALSNNGRHHDVIHVTSYGKLCLTENGPCAYRYN